MRLVDSDSTGRPTPRSGIEALDADTMPSPGLRPDVLAGPEHEQRRRAVEAALFGDVAEAVSLGRYRLLHRLGEGGMGSVYAAYDDRLDRKIALKLIRASKLDSVEVRERTRREARALARLSHPNVVHVYEVGEVEGQIFVAMEFLAGPTLRTWLDGQERPWQEVLAVLRQAGEGLAAAHAHGIIHRDFKPHNAMFGADGRVRVLDFGLARMGEAEEARGDGPVGSPDIPTHALTMTGTVLGTPAYMAPEQFSQRKADARSDQFSFCVTLYEALYGHRPFQGQTLAQLAAEVTAGRVATRPKNTRVPLWVHHALLRGLQTDPNKRWPSMQELLVTLAGAPGARLRRIAASVALVAATGGAGFALAASNAVEQCPDARAELAGSWDEGRAAAVRDAVMSKHGQLGNEVLGLVEPKIDRYVEQWVDMRNESCRAHAEGRQSANVFDLRTACLDQRRASLDAVVRALESAEGEKLHSVELAVAGLPPMERCGDVQALTATIAPPEGAAMQTRVQAHRERLARAYVLEDMGDYSEGLPLIAEVLADAEAMTYEPLRAEAYLYKGSMEMMSGNSEEAAVSYDMALYSALGIGHASVAALVSSKRGFLYSYGMGLKERGLAEIPLIEALIRPARDDVDVYAESLNNLGMIYHSNGELIKSRRALEDAHAWREAHGRGRTGKGLITLRNLTLIAAEERRFDEAEALFDRFERISEGVISKYSPIYMMHLNLRSQFYGHLGRPRASDELARRVAEHSVRKPDMIAALNQLAWSAIEDRDTMTARRYAAEIEALRRDESDPRAAFESQLTRLRIAAADGDEAAVRSYYDDLRAQVGDPVRDRLHRWLLFIYSLALEQLGHLREALDTLTELEAAERASSGEDEVDTNMWLRFGRLHRRLGEFAAAEARLEDVRAEYEASITPPTWSAALLLEFGELALARLRDDEAVEYLTEAESILVATAEPDFLPLARTRFALARALAGHASPVPTTARVHAEVALEVFRAKNRQDEAREVEDWLAQHP